jgi:hypothetical protein
MIIGIIILERNYVGRNIELLLWWNTNAERSIAEMN